MFNYIRLCAGAEVPKSWIEVTPQKDGRYFAQYCNPAGGRLSWIGAFGKTATDATKNIIELLIGVQEKMFACKPPDIFIGDDKIMVQSKK